MWRGLKKIEEKRQKQSNKNWSLELFSVWFGIGFSQPDLTFTIPLGDAGVGAAILEADVGNMEDGQMAPLRVRADRRHAQVVGLAQSVPGPADPAVQVPSQDDSRMKNSRV